jgi:chemotaxis protein methyltransferase CheR
LDFLGAVFERRLMRLDISAKHYLCLLSAGALPSEPVALADELTVGETYFFRNSEQFRALVDVVVPARMRAAGQHRSLGILSAGCASGEEAYSLAIALHDAIPDPRWEVAVRAVDISPAALARAARAHYSAWALRETPVDVRRRWFRPVGRELALAENARACVHFENRNLAADDTALWQPQSFDIIFCRNVIMYFTRDQAGILLRRLARSLRPGGYLFLGHAETMRGFSEDFDLVQSHDTFYYRRQDDVPTAVSPRPASRDAPVGCPAVADSADPDGDWMAAIRGAGDRVAALVAAMQATPQSPAPVAERWDLGTALDLLRSERFSEALVSIGRLPPGPANDPDVLLLTAAIQVHGGQPAAAEATCGRLLAAGGLNAGAQYVLALCREALGEVARAAEHDRIAVHLDGSFAMPRLHLGLLTRRSGDRDGARRELRQALVLLRREDPLRLLMFGGGFGRAGLISLCEAALRDCGGGL